MSTQQYKKACVFGGTGFIGRQVVRELAHQGYMVKIATRVPERAYFLKTCGNVGQVVPVACNYAVESDLAFAVKGCDVVVNCIGILQQTGDSSFQKIHSDLPRAIAKACRDEKVARFVHVSALGCEQAKSKYGKSKRAGEAAVLENFPKATILRPSVVFGVEDNFFNKFAKLSVVMPFLPLIGGGKTKFQPVYVGDIADAVIAALATGESQGKVYELGGPDVVTFEEIYQNLFAATGRKKMLVPLPFALAKIKGGVLDGITRILSLRLLLGPQQNPIISADQVESLKTDSVVSTGALGFRDLGIMPKDMAVILPTYLERYRPGGRFGDKKRA